MDVYASEQEQIEALKKWWRENAMALIVGAVIGLGGLFGWQYWQRHIDERGGAASAAYEALTVASQAGRHDEVLTQGKTLINEYSDTPYANLAGLLMAKADVEKGDLPAAQERLRWVLDHADTDELRHIARLRLARVMLDLKDAAGVKALLQGVDFGKFVALYQEVEGDLAVQTGDVNAAREAYRKALASSDAGNSALVQLKLDQLGLTPDEAIQ